MFDTLKAISLVEGRLAEYQAHNETGQHFQAIGALELVLNDLNNELHAQMLVMDQFAKEIEDGNENRTEA